MKISFYLIITLIFVVGIEFSGSAYGESSKVQIIIPSGTFSPGCEVSDACFSPTSLTINAGDIVEWKNIDTAAHTITGGSPNDGPSGVFDSSLIMGGESFEYTFDVAGRYDYFCMVHPWMIGTVNVVQSSLSSSNLSSETKDISESNKPIQKTSANNVTPKPIKERTCVPNKICVFPGDYLKYESKMGTSIFTDEYYFGNFVEDGRIFVRSESSSFDPEQQSLLEEIDPALAERYKLHKQSVTDTETFILDLSTGLTDEETESYGCCARFPYFVKTPIKIGDKMPGANPFNDSEVFNNDGKYLYHDFERDVIIAEDEKDEDDSGFWMISTWIVDKETGINLENSLEHPGQDIDIEFGMGSKNSDGIIITKRLSQLTDTNIIQGNTKQKITGESHKIEQNSQNMEQTSNTSKGGGCLIATATYGSELAPQVQQLRELRDNSLLQTESGATFMSSFNDFYYSFSPTIADWERENPAFKEFVKISLTPMISSLSILNYVNMDSEVSVLGYGISLILLNGMMYVGLPIIGVISLRKVIH